MLNHGQPAVVGRLDELGAVRRNVFEIQLLVLAFIGINSRAGEGRHHRRFARRRFTVALYLEIGMRNDRLLAIVGDFPSDVDDIGVTVEGQDLGDLAAVGAIGLQADLKFVGAVGQLVRAGDTAEGRAMRRQAFANQATLSKILVAGGVEEDEVFLLVVVFLVIEQFEADDVSALGGNCRFHQIGADREGFPGGCRVHRHGRTASRGSCLQGAGRLRRGACSRVSRFGSDRRLRLVVLLPVFPQHEAGKSEDQNQDQATSVH